MKRLLTFAVVVIAALSLCACGQKVEVSAWQEQYDLGVRYLSEGKYEEAVLAFTAAIEIDPKQADAYIGRGDAYIGLGETEENLAKALADYEAAIAGDASAIAAYLGLADAYIRMGDYDKALEVLKDALEQTGNDPRISEKIAELESGNVSDSSGNQRKMSAYDRDGNLMWYHTYTYDKDGGEISVTSFDHNGIQTGHVDTSNGHNLSVSYWSGRDTGVVGRLDVYHDEEGRLIKIVQYSEETGEVTSGTTFVYDEEGRLVRDDNYSYTENGVKLLQGYQTYEYTDQGSKSKCSQYSPDGVLISYTIYTYHEDGKSDEWLYYNGDGTLRRRMVARYDSQGGYIGEDTYDGEGNLIQSRNYEYE